MDLMNNLLLPKILKMISKFMYFLILFKIYMSLCDFVIVKYSEFNDIFNGEHIGKTYKSWTDIISNRHNRFLLKSSLKNEMLLECMYILTYKDEICCFFIYDNYLYYGDIFDILVNPHKNKDEIISVLINLLSDKCYILVIHNTKYLSLNNEVYYENIDFDFLDDNKYKVYTINNNDSNTSTNFSYIILSISKITGGIPVIVNVYKSEHDTTVSQSFETNLIYAKYDISSDINNFSRFFHKVLFETPLCICSNNYNISDDTWFNLYPQTNHNKIDFKQLHLIEEIIDINDKRYHIIYGIEYDNYSLYYEDTDYMDGHYKKIEKIKNDIKYKNWMIVYQYIKKYYKPYKKFEKDWDNFKLLDLPSLVLNNILSYLDISDILSFRQSNTKCNYIFKKYSPSFDNNILNINNGDIVSFDINIDKNLKLVKYLNNQFNNTTSNPKIYFNVTNCCSYIDNKIKYNIDIDFINNVKYISKLELLVDDNLTELFEYIIQTDTCKYIKSLSLINPNLESLLFAEQLLNLECLKLNFNCRISDKICEIMYNYLINSELADKLKCLDMGSIPYSLLDWNSLFSKLKNIEQLYIYYGSFVIEERDDQDKYLMDIYNNIKNMYNLKLLHLIEFNTEELYIPDDLFNNLKSLRNLHIDGLTNEQCKNLKSLEILSTRYIDDEQYENLINLKQLCIYGIKEDNLKYLKKLSILRLNECSPYYHKHYFTDVSYKV